MRGGLGDGKAGKLCNLCKLLFPMFKMELILLAAPSCLNSLNIKAIYHHKH